MTYWGTWNYAGGNGVRIGADWSYSGNVLNVSISTQTQYRFSGNNTHLNWSGSWTGGPFNYNFSSSAQQVKTIWSGSFTQGRDSTVTLNFSMSGFYTGATATVSFSSYLAPAAPPPPSIGQVELSSTTFEMGTTVTMTARRRDISHGCQFRYVFGDVTAGGVQGWIDPPGHTGIVWYGGAPDTQTWDFPVSLLAPVIPNLASWSGIILCDYFDSGGGFIGTSLVWFTVVVPPTVIPTLTTVTAVESAGTASIATTVGQFVQGLSAIKCDLSGEAGIYGSTIVSKGFTVNGVDYAGASITLPVLTASGALDILATVVDSRGRSGTMSITPSVLAYSAPRITGFTVARCAIDGTLNNLGTYAKIITAGSVSSLMNVTQKNWLTWTLYSRLVGTSSWGTAIKNTTNGLTWSATDVLGAGGYSASNAYEFALACMDRFNTTSSIVIVPTGIVTMSWDKTGVGIGKVRQQGALDVSGDIYESGTKLSDKYALNLIQHYQVRVATVSKTGGQTLTTLTIPAQTKASRVRVRWLGQSGFSSGANITSALAATASGTGVTVYTHYNRELFMPTAGSWSNTPQWYEADVSMPAATATTITITAVITGGSNCYFGGTLFADIVLEGSCG